LRKGLRTEEEKAKNQEKKGKKRLQKKPFLLVRHFYPPPKSFKHWKKEAPGRTVPISHPGSISQAFSPRILWSENLHCSNSLAEKVLFHPSWQTDTTRDRVQRTFVTASRAIRRGCSAKV
jgi:hypothetical protein